MCFYLCSRLQDNIGQCLIQCGVAITCVANSASYAHIAMIFLNQVK